MDTKKIKKVKQNWISLEVIGIILLFSAVALVQSILVITFWQTICLTIGLSLIVVSFQMMFAPLMSAIIDVVDEDKNADNQTT